MASNYNVTPQEAADKIDPGEAATFDKAKQTFDDIIKTLGDENRNIVNNTNTVVAKGVCQGEASAAFHTAVMKVVNGYLRPTMQVLGTYPGQMTTGSTAFTTAKVAI